MPTSQATVESLSIEVKALRIDGRKMTITFFQQLPNVRLLMNPKGEEPTIREGLKPWGYVRHKIRDEGDLWLVSERNGELCRSSLHIMEEYQYSRNSENILSEFRREILTRYEQLFIAT